MTCPDATNGGECPRYQAADPSLHVLEVRNGGRRRAVLVFYAIHNTAMTHDCTLYQSDRAGRAMQTLDANAKVAAARRSFPAIPAPGVTVELTKPGSGVGELGGAEDGRTVLYAYGWHAGVTGTDIRVPALDLYKPAVLKLLQRALDSPKSYPVSVASVGPLAEATGRLHVLIGLANEYIGYTATEAEFAAQDYEGASTMYGAKQGRVLGDLLAAVSREEEKSAPEVAPAVYHPGLRSPFHFGPEFFGGRSDAQNRVDDGAPRFEWDESPAGDWRARERGVRILREDAKGWRPVDDDSGANILTVLISGKERRWSAIWIAPRPLEKDARYAFEVRRSVGEVR